LLLQEQGEWGMNIFRYVIAPALLAGLWIGVSVLGVGVLVTEKEEKNGEVSLASVPADPGLPSGEKFEGSGKRSK
jgi:hypothetical protein